MFEKNLPVADSPSPKIAALRAFHKEWADAKELELDIAPALRAVWSNAIDQAIASTYSFEGLKELRAEPMANSGQIKSIRKKIKGLGIQPATATVTTTVRTARHIDHGPNHTRIYAN